jgi:small subunit ribosomal protein S2
VIIKLLLQISFLFIIIFLIRLFGKEQKQKKSKINQLEIEVGELNESDRTKEDLGPRELKKADDLTRITGIGPKISDILRDAGITTYAKLAGSEETELKAILEESQIRFADPGSWKQQAEELL